MLNKKILIPITLVATAIFAIGYSLTTNFEPIKDIFNVSKQLDTLDTPPDPQPKDVSQMFNERGFYKSNGFTADESEIINNFNGNLMFSIPLYKSAGRNGVDLDIKLNYNGSVGHTVILSTEQNYINTNALNIRKYNINSPEWILSVNGIGVQTFNFEDRMLTQPTGSEVAGNDVKKLIPGYHFDDRLRPSGSTDKDRITILMGDGSTITLVNSDEHTSGSYVGLYRGEGKGSHIIANVFYDETDQTTSGNYKNRYVELMMGDGLQYVFREYKFDYRDVTVGANMENSRKPQILLLEKIRDMFGVYINFMYDLSFSSKGRPKLLSIGSYKDVFELYYGNLPGGASNGVLITNIHQGTFRFLFDEFTYINGAGGNKTGTITTIKNPVNNSATISYTNYQRKLTNVPYTQSDKIINCDNLKRITEFNNFLGGKRSYSYFGTANMTINATLSIMRSTTDFKGYGRDPFYTNMIIDKTDYFSPSVQKSYTTFEYPFTDAGGDFDNNNYDPNDYYATDIKTESRNSGTVNESQNLWNVYKYKIYPARTSSYSANENFDIEGQTKLITEETKQPDGNIYSKNDYEYDIATCNTFCPGSFLMTKKTNTVGNQSRVWDYLYKFDNNFYDSTLSERVEIDPSGYKTKVTFSKFFKEIWYLDSDHGPSGPIDTLSFLEANTFYKIDLAVDQKRYNKSTNRTEYPENDISAGLLSFSKNVYCEDTLHTSAYIGQLLSTRVYNEQNFTQYIHTDYEYYKKDPIGKALYNPGRLPFIEGNLKRVLKENSQEERYFYFPISNGQNLLYEETDDVEGALPLPEISYKIKRNNGTVVLKKDVFIDQRMPVRIDKYKRINSNTVDTISIINMKYNNAGKPSLIVNENGFASQMEYDYSYNRIRAITLPGDFSEQESYDEITVNTITADTTMLIRSTGIGHLDISNGINPRFIYSHAMRWSVLLRMLDDNESEFKFHPFIKFDFNDLKAFNSISAATLRIAPLTYTLFTGSPQAPSPQNSGYSVNLKPAYGHGITTVSDLQYADQNPQYYSVSTNNVIGPYPSSSWYGYTSVCNYNEHVNNANVKPILDYLKSNDKNLYGIILSPQKDGPEEYNRERFIMNFQDCPNSDTSIWKSNWKPDLEITGSYTRRDTIRARIIMGGTIVYEYDDYNHTVKVKNRLNHSPGTFKTVRYHFDGFGNTSQKDVFTTNTLYDSYQYKYNFINQLAEDIDALNHSTKFSYDILQRNTLTKFADYSTTNNTFGYTSSLGGYFNGYNEFVEIQEFRDESKKKFYKYYDAVGNLLRELKYVSGNSDPDSPFDPDTTGNEMDDPGDIQLTTDYKYDNRYRLIEVKTPNGKSITYTYDAYGRQYSRNTPDAGITKYLYDNNSNLKFTQDAAQQTRGNNIFTFRNYDALNRLLSIGETQLGNSYPDFDNIDPENPPELDSPFGTDMFVINIYDTIHNPSFSNFSSNKPTDFSTSPNYTKGKLVATAYRTRLTDNWNYKYYRYDARGNAMKMWNYIDGLGWKSMTYQYNSQSQNTYFDYQPNQTDGKQFKFGYDEAGRLIESAFYTGSWTPTPEEDDGPNSFYNLTRYTYNANSQIATHGHNGNALMTNYNYNVRNWIFNTTQGSTPVFRYVLLYNGNGNIRYQSLQGSYNDNFAETTDRQVFYIYDKSNRLLTSEYRNLSYTFHGKVVNSYDNDGNFLVMKRYNSSNSLLDNFNYSYYSATNRLQKVSGTKNQYTYDNNGNLTSDDLNKNQDITYDYRNLMLENTNKASLFTFKTKYWYDEAGNRIRKQVMRYDPEGGIEEGDGSGSWVLDRDEFYVRDLSGKEIAIYYGSTLQQWNIYGLDQIGHMKADLSKFFYLKDHLGSTRAVIDTLSQVVSAQDYDPWGYLMENRTYETGSSKYKFTGKERDRDIESNYDYFGARYYDSRVANWTSIDPLFEKHYDYSPYNYVLRNPMVLIDPDGKQVDVNEQRAKYLLDKEIGVYEKVITNFSEAATPKLAAGAKFAVKFAIKQGINYTLQFIEYKTKLDLATVKFGFGLAFTFFSLEGETSPKSEQEEMNKNISRWRAEDKDRLEKENAKKEKEKTEKVTKFIEEKLFKKQKNTIKLIY